MTMEIWQPDEPTAAPAPQAKQSFWRRRAGRIVAVASVSALALGGIGIAAFDTSATTATTAESSTTSSSTTSGADFTAPSGRGGVTYGGHTYTYEWGDSGDSSSGSTGLSTSTQEDATEASDDESTGIVIIETVLGYQEAAAAGTGIVLTSDGLILTNNHVIEGSTEIQVTIASTGETYTATVVGVDTENDVAVLQLEGASGLTTATIDDDGDPVVGDDVTAVGNAEGGGVLMAADGTVTELESTVTTSSEYTIEGETLDGMIEFEADVVSGDSGGALIDDEGEVVGVTTAASTGLATTVAYAIPIEDALAIVEQIVAGDESGTVEVGYPAFLGIGLSATNAAANVPGSRSGTSTTTTTDGVEIGYVYEGTGAAEAGLVVGDVITALDGTTVSTGDELSALIAEYEPGDTVTVTYTDTDGATQTVTVTLGEGPAA